MAIQFADRVRVTTATTGTGTISLGTAVSGFRTFAAAVTAGAIGSGGTVYYVVEDGTAWEVGSGVYTAGSPDTLTRSVAASSLGGTTALSLSGTAQVYITLTAAGVLNATITGGTINNATIGASTATTGAFTTLSATGTTTLAAANASGQIVSSVSGAGAFRIATSSYGVFDYSDNSSYYKLLTNSGSPLASYNTLRPFAINLASGYVSMQNGVSISAGLTADTLTVSSTVSGAGFTSLLSPYALLASPTFTGTPATPTPSVDTNTTQIASTAFVLGQASSASPSNDASVAAVGSSTRYARADHVHAAPSRTLVDTGAFALTSGATVSTNAANGNVFTLTLGTNATLANPTNLVTGAHYQWIIKQDGTGSRTLSYGTIFKWVNKATPTLTTAANSVDVITGVYDGTNIYCSLAANFG